MLEICFAFLNFAVARSNVLLCSRAEYVNRGESFYTGKTEGFKNGLGLRELRSWQTRNEICVRLMRCSNVLLCRAIARIGEVPQAEGFGKNQRCSFSNLAAKPLRG